MEKKMNDIISMLTLSGSDKREQVINSIVLDCIYKCESSIEKKDLPEYIKTEYDVVIHNLEIDSALNELKESNRIHLKGDTISLSEFGKEGYDKSKDDSLKSFKERQYELDQLLIEISSESISADNRGVIRKMFSEYLYECFFEFGKNTVEVFLPTSNSKDINDATVKILNSKLLLLDEKHHDVFKLLVSEFPNKINEPILDYLNELSDKVESFFSLGLSKELHEEVTNLNMLDWTIFLDTNFLFTILNLGANPERNLCFDLIDLVNKNKSNIKFKYIPQTLSELVDRQADLLKSIPRLSYNKAHLEVLLKTDKLDAFERSYYERRLLNGNTPHPADILKYARESLREINIEFYNSEFKSLKGDIQFLDIKCGDYTNYEGFLNDVREEKGFPVKEVKSYKKTYHDMFLREAILQLRNSKTTLISEAKFFGLTLDKILLKFDNYEIRKKSSHNIIPTFFYPPQLLKKLLKVFPISTNNYKRAFISAISSPTFHNERHNDKSLVLQKSVSFFRELGITDQKVMLNIVADELFLEKFEEIENTKDLKPFVESKIQEQLDALSETVKTITDKLKSREDLLSETAKDNDEKGVEFENLSKKHISVLEQVELLKAELAKSRTIKTKSTVNGQITIDDGIKEISNEEKRKELASDLKDQVESDILTHKIKELKKWRRKTWLNLLWVIPLLFVCCLLIFDNPYFHFLKLNPDGTEHNTAPTIIGVILALLNLVFFKIFFVRFISEREKNAKMDSIPIPLELKKKLEKANKNL